eukprot:scaffold17.g599.t1
MGQQGELIWGGLPSTSSACPTEPLDLLDSSQRTAAKALRVLLGSGVPLAHSQLRAKLGGAEDHASKCIFELAVLSLVEQGIVVRHGIGNWALLRVPDAQVRRAEALAFSEFDAGDDSRLLLALQQLAPRQQCAVVSPALPLLRRPHGSSPRSEGSGPRMRVPRGIEKASGRQGRSKRTAGSLSGGGDDLAAQLQLKKMRLSGGSSGAFLLAGSLSCSPHAAAPMQLSP